MRRLSISRIYAGECQTLAQPFGPVRRFPHAPPPARGDIDGVQPS
jgi:hypothetical protein